MNKEHVKILLSGHEKWNEWRESDHDLIPDLSDFDLAEIPFSELSENSPLSFCIASSRDEGCVDLSSFNLENVDFRNAKLKDVRLREGRLSGADLSGADFTGGDLTEATLFSANISRAIFKGATLNDAWLPEAYCEDDAGANFANVKARGAIFFYGNFAHSDFKQADLREAWLGQANFEDCAFEETDLRGARIRGTNFSGSMFRDAVLKRVVFDPRALRRDAVKHWKEVSGLQRIEMDGSLRAILLDQDFVSSRIEAFGNEWPQFSEMLRNAVEKRRRGAQSFSDETWIMRVRARTTDMFVNIVSPLLDAYSYLHVLLRGLASATAFVGLLGFVFHYFAIHPERIDPIFKSLRNFSFDWTAPVNLGLISYGAAGFAAFGALNSWYGRRLAFAIWGAVFNYGRSWERVASIALLGIGVFGFLYQGADPKDICVLKPGSETQCVVFGDGTHWAYPYFVAALGFLTLGLQSDVIPLSGHGQMLVLANVVCGWLTFGLLISILQNQFAERTLHH